MKKIMVMMLMVVMASLASPLFAANASPPSFENTFKTNAGKLNINVNRGAATAEDIGCSLKVGIHQRDTLMYSLDATSENKFMKISGRRYDAKINLARATMAVVCQKRGEVGV